MNRIREQNKAHCDNTGHECAAPFHVEKTLH